VNKGKKKKGRIMPGTSTTKASAIICFGMALYLVKMNLTRTDPLLPVDQLTQLIRGAILPSVESLTKLQAQGKVVSGGYPIGRPAIVLLVDAHSEEELYEILKDLPIWEQTEAEITRMQGFEELVSPDETA
jgi:muconolactone delta-isomerase